MKTGWTWRTLSLLVCDMVSAALKVNSYKILMPLFWKSSNYIGEKIQWTNSKLD
jgi:hypothetical protein